MSNSNGADSNSEKLTENTSVESIKKYLTFVSDNLIFGIDASYITEIIINHNITFLPIVPYYIRCV